MGDKIKLFDGSDEEEQEDVEFRTNKSYAKNYDEFRKKEILGQLKNLKEELGSEDDSSDDDTTDDEIVDPEFDKEFFRTLAFLKRKDKDKYSEQQTFFENVKPIEEVALTKRHHKEKPMTVKDYERKVMLEKGGVFEDEEDLGEPVVGRSASPTMVEEERKIKDEIRQALSKIGDDESEEEEEDGKGGGLLKERTKSAAEKEKEQSDYIQWLADSKAPEPPSEEVKVLEPLKHFWSSEKLSKEDAFLKDYILNKRFVQSSGEVPTYDEIVATSEDEEELDKQEDYERQYNFRFEEPDPEYIKQFPRQVEDSVRVERNKRKEQRQAVKERKQKEKEEKRRELEELKAIKLKEIREKIQRLKEIAATEKLAMDVDDLESEFDPDEHDRRMKEMFNDDYYGVDEGDQKPEFPDLDKELGVENYDVERLEDGDEADAGPYCEDDDFVMDCEYEEKVESAQSAKEAHQQELLEATGKGKKKGRRQSKFREVLKAEKPLFDPEDEKTYGQYIDEYYKLDYEDMIGDTPCRFKYVETVPNDYGLTIEEILMANTKELNKWASVKKTVQIRPKNVELNEIELYKKKAASETMKRRVLPSLYTFDEEEVEDEEILKNKKEALQTSLQKKQEPRQTTGKQKGKEKGGENGSTSGVKDQNTESNASPKKKKKKEKIKKDKKSNEANSSEDGKIDKQTKKNGKPSKPSTTVQDGTVNSPRKRKLDSTEDKKTNGHMNDSKRGRFGQNGQSNGFRGGDSRGRGGPEAGNRGAGPGRGGFRGRGGHHGGDRGGRGGRGGFGGRGGLHGGERGGYRGAGRGGGRGGQTGHGVGSGGTKKEGNANEQRLRAFGLNPTKFHNKQIYGKQAQRNNGGNSEKHLNKKTIFTN